MATQFGGTTYNTRSLRIGGGELMTFKHGHGLKAFWQALICQGSDETDVTDPNTAGNTIGSYVMQLRYHGRRWQATAYWERMFEDQSMLTVQYGIRDMLIGGEVRPPRNPYVSSAVVEYLTSTDQSGAVYHDRTATIRDKMNGRDDYYNHNLYAGWQNYGHGIGNPLITSPLYNDVFGHANTLSFYNNRVKYGIRIALLRLVRPETPADAEVRRPVQSGRSQRLLARSPAARCVVPRNKEELMRTGRERERAARDKIR